MYFSVGPHSNEVKAVKQEKPPALLLSYGRWNKYSGEQTRYNKDTPIKEFIEDIGYEPLIILDSGAYQFHKLPENPVVLCLPIIHFYQQELDIPADEAGYRYLQDRYLYMSVKDEYWRRELMMRNHEAYDREEEDEYPDYNDFIEEYQSLEHETIHQFYEFYGLNRSSIHHVFSMDVIHDPDNSMLSYYFFKGLGLPIIPVYHYGSDMRYLHQYVKDGNSYIGLGGSAFGVPPQERIHWCNEITSMYPDIRFHLLGTNCQKIIQNTPGLYSADGAYWIQSAGAKKIRKRGESIVEKSTGNIRKILRWSESCQQTLF